MAKTHTTITVDQELLEEVNNMNINKSGLFNDFLKSFVRQQRGDSEAIDIKLERIEVEKLTNKISKLQAKLISSKEKIEKYEAAIKLKEEQDLKEEKERIENAKRCDNCKELKADTMKMHKFGSKTICNGCYMSATPNMIRKWNNAGVVESEK